MSDLAGVGGVGVRKSAKVLIVLDNAKVRATIRKVYKMIVLREFGPTLEGSVLTEGNNGLGFAGRKIDSEPETGKTFGSDIYEGCELG